MSYLFHDINIFFKTFFTMSSDRLELYSGETWRKFSHYKDWAFTPSWGRFAGWVCKLRHCGAYIGMGLKAV